MNTALAFFIMFNVLVWGIQTLLDLRIKHIVPSLTLPVGVSTLLVTPENFYATAGLALLVFPLHYSNSFARGETSLYLTYLLSTITHPVLGLQTLLFTSAGYILFLEEILDIENYPLAPAFSTSVTLVYLLGFAL